MKTIKGISLTTGSGIIRGQEYADCLFTLCTTTTFKECTFINCTFENNKYVKFSDCIKTNCITKNELK